MLRIERVLNVARRSLGHDVAFISQFAGNERTFRYVQGSAESPIRQGETTPIAGSHCEAMIAGRLPNIIADTHADPVAAEMAVTYDLDIRSYAGVPIRLSDGTLFGTFCCVAHTPSAGLGEKEITLLKDLATLVVDEIERDMRLEAIRSERLERIENLFKTDGPTILYQPVCMLDELRIAGAEALSRFKGAGDYPVDRWFSDAAELATERIWN